MTNNKPKLVRITLSLPPRALSPNARGHWAKKAAAAAEFRRESFLKARSALVCSRPRWREVTIDVRAYYATPTRTHDPDNLLASCKAAIDGLTDAGLLEDDDCITYILHPGRVDGRGSRVELMIWPGGVE